MLNVPIEQESFLMRHKGQRCHGNASPIPRTHSTLMKSQTLYGIDCRKTPYVLLLRVIFARNISGYLISFHYSSQTNVFSISNSGIWIILKLSLAFQLPFNTIIYLDFVNSIKGNIIRRNLI